MKNLNKLQKTFILVAAGVFAVVLIVSVVLCFPEAVGTLNTEQANTGNSNITEDTTKDETESETQTEGDSETEGTKETENTQTEEDSQTEDSQTETILGGGNASTNTSGIAALDNSSEGWGPGGDRNELNQYACCFYYNNKYKDYGAYFMVENSNYVYLTFDEGYENGYTPKILDTLKEKNVKAVFFITAQFFRENPDLIQRMIDEGHVVGNHSVSHPSKGMPSLSIEAQKNDIMTLHNNVLDKFGYEMKLFRNPAGIFSEQSLAVTNSCGYKSIFWSFAYLDYDPANQPDQAASLNRLMNNLHPGAIYLLHAVSETNTEILGDFIDQARAKGFEFAVIQ